MKVISEPDTYDFFDKAYDDCTIRYGDMKKQLAEDIIKFTAPLREKIIETGNDTGYLRKVAEMGKEKAMESASKTIEDVRNIIGFKSF